MRQTSRRCSLRPRRPPCGPRCRSCPRSSCRRGCRKRIQASFSVTSLPVHGSHVGRLNGSRPNGPFASEATGAAANGWRCGGRPPVSLGRGRGAAVAAGRSLHHEHVARGEVATVLSGHLVPRPVCPLHPVAPAATVLAAREPVGRDDAVLGRHREIRLLQEPEAAAPAVPPSPSVEWRCSRRIADRHRAPAPPRACRAARTPNLPRIRHRWSTTDWEC